MKYKIKQNIIKIKIKFMNFKIIQLGKKMISKFEIIYKSNLLILNFLMSTFHF